MTINKNKEINDSPDILIDSPLLDSQLLKLKIEQDPKRFRFFFLGHF